MVFNAREIFEMAVQIEKNGANYYRLAAEGATDTRTRQLFYDLAAMEDEHKKIFIAMMEELSPQERELTAQDPYGEAVYYLRAMADGQVFDVKADPARLLMEQKTREDILKMAINFEKDSIVFYLSMKELIPQRLGKDKIDSILKEEMSHIILLSKELEALKQ